MPDADEWLNERFQLVMSRVAQIKEESAGAVYGEYMGMLADFFLKNNADQGRARADYQKELESYDSSFASVSYCREQFGSDGLFLSVIYTDLHSACAWESQEWKCIFTELFMELYQMLMDPDRSMEALREVLYWFHSDYSELYAALQFKLMAEGKTADPLCCLKPARLQFGDDEAGGLARYYEEHQEDDALYMGGRFIERLRAAYTKAYESHHREQRALIVLSKEYEGYRGTGLDDVMKRNKHQQKEYALLEEEIKKILESERVYK